MRKKNAALPAHRKYKCDPPPFDLIIRAISSDEEAIYEIIQLFQPLIKSKARRQIISEDGRIGYYVDPFVKGQIESRLMYVMLNYKRLRQR